MPDVDVSSLPPDLTENEAEMNIQMSWSHKITQDTKYVVES